MDELTKEFLIESQEGLDRMERCLTELEERPEETALLSEIFRSVHTIKGTTGFLGFSRLEKLAHSGENLLGLLRDGKLKATPPIISSLLVLMDGLRAILRTIEETGKEGTGDDSALIGRLNAHRESGDQAPPAPAPEAAKPAAAAPPPPPTPAPVAEAEPRAEAKPATPPAAPEGEASAATVEVPPMPRVSESTLRVDVTLLNRMMNLVGELVLTRNQILQATSADPNLTMLSRRLDMVTADLRENVMRARMQPVSHAFSKFPRVVRDLAHGLGRRVRLQMEGQETELDKSLLEAIKDPLTHAVRNSLDHGIEPPDEREAQGKDPEGTLRLRAFQEGSHVIIEVSDDGHGIDVEKVKAKAIERGLISLEKASQMAERELMQLIFLPGFSTAEQVTKVSGRGVGMDVVRTNVEKIGGKVEVDSRLGKGTTLRLRIPLTLAIIPALIVRTAGQSYALPQGALSELVHLRAGDTAKSIEWIEGSPLYRLRGNLLPLIFLEKMLKPGQTNTSDERDYYIAVLDAEGRRFGLVIDGLEDPEEIVVKPLSSILKTIGLFSGATVLGNGKLALILDPGVIASRAGVQMLGDEEAEEAEESLEQKVSSEFLLVESSGVRSAVPLKQVLRIERLPASRIEFMEGRPVINFEGLILPVEDAGGLLSQVTGDDMQLTVVVCREGARHVGFAVSHVLDVASGADLHEAGTNSLAQGVTLLKDKVTGIINVGNEGWAPGDEITDLHDSITEPMAESAL